MKRIFLVADDFGISPGVDKAIVDLAVQNRLAGTGCMTTFAQWPQAARALTSLPSSFETGLHLTLTDQPALTGSTVLAPSGVLPTFSRLTLALATGMVPPRVLEAELDAQLELFCDHLGRTPHYMDGHQHVHFLGPVRRWMVKRFAGEDTKPWLRGSPQAPNAFDPSSGKIRIVRLLSRRFEHTMAAAGFTVKSPLFGFYRWEDQSRAAFSAMLTRDFALAPNDAVIMSHPGKADEMLRNRDRFTDAREIEADFLASTEFAELCAENAINPGHQAR
jgi:predicted glycoside hydrolase/deacetylase ChbG (UPF0249 family)